MNKYLAAIYRNDFHSLDTYISQRSFKDWNDINEALRVVLGDRDLEKKTRIRSAQTLLLAEANPNGRDGNGKPYLLNLYREDDIEFCHLLINFQCDLNLTDEDGNTALHVAAEEGNPDLYGLLLDSGADVNAVDCNHQTALMKGISKNPTPELFDLLLIDADLGISAEGSGFTALHFAALFNKAKELTALITNGAKVNKVNQYGENALHTACYGSTCCEVFRILLSSGINPDLKNESGDTPLHLLVAKDISVNVMEVLLSHPNIDINAKNLNQQTPLFMAIDFKEIDKIKLLIKSNCDVNSLCSSLRLNTKMTALDLSIYLSDARITRILLFLTDAKCKVYSGNDIEKVLKEQPNEEIDDTYLTQKTKGLKQICRLKIRKSIKSQPAKKISMLKIPTQLKDYLSLKEIDNM